MQLTALHPQPNLGVHASSRHLLLCLHGYRQTASDTPLSEPVLVEYFLHGMSEVMKQLPRRGWTMASTSAVFVSASPSASMLGRGVSNNFAFFEGFGLFLSWGHFSSFRGRKCSAYVLAVAVKSVFMVAFWCRMYRCRWYDIVEDTRAGRR